MWLFHFKHATTMHSTEWSMFEECSCTGPHLGFHTVWRITASGFVLWWYGGETDLNTAFWNAYIQWTSLDSTEPPTVIHAATLAESCPLDVFLHRPLYYLKTAINLNKYPLHVKYHIIHLECKLKNRTFYFHNSQFSLEQQSSLFHSDWNLTWRITGKGPLVLFKILPHSTDGDNISFSQAPDNLFKLKTPITFLNGQPKPHSLPQNKQVFFSKCSRHR